MLDQVQSRRGQRRAARETLGALARFEQLGARLWARNARAEARPPEFVARPRS